MNERDQRVREIAYFLWLGEGCPDQEAERHWRAAEAWHDSEDAERKSIEGEPPGEPAEEVSVPPIEKPDASIAAVPGSPRAASRRAC